MDLSLVSVDELIKELDKRYEAIVLCTSKPSANGDAFDWHMEGNRMTCLGLVTKTKEHISANLNAEETGEMSAD
jgi:hypothetical protein